MFSLRAVVAIAATGLLSLVNAEPYNITLTDVSPTIQYLPSRDGDPTTTWNTSYTISGQWNSAPGSIGQGESLHYTEADGASASVGFVGTAVYVWGYNYGLEGDVRLAVGGQELDTAGAGDGFLGKMEGMKNQWWDLTINKTAGGGQRNGFDLRRVVITVDFGGKGATFSNDTLSSLDENDNPNSQISFSGSWTTGTEAGLARQNYTRVDTYGQDARIFIPTLSGVGASLAIVYGSVNEDHAAYGFWPSEPAPNWPRSQFFNGSSPWIAINQVVWFGVIEGGNIVGQNLNGSYWFDVSRVDFITASGGSSGGGASAGTIAGGVVGGLAGLALILGGVWFLWRRRRRSGPAHYKSGRSDSDGFEIDPYKEVGTAEADAHSGYAEDIEMTYTDRSTTDGHDTASPSQQRPSTDTPSQSVSATALLPATTSTSPTATQTPQTDRPTRLTLVSPEPGTESFPETQTQTPQQPTPAESERKSRRQQRAAAQQAGFVQETDAGRVALLPPSYDPAWAQEGLEGSPSASQSQSPSSETEASSPPEIGANNNPEADAELQRADSESPAAASPAPTHTHAEAELGAKANNEPASPNLPKDDPA